MQGRLSSKGETAWVDIRTEQSHALRFGDAAHES